MQRVRQHITQRQGEFGGHRFLRMLAATPPLSLTVPFVSHATFFIFAFQDVMRTIAERASEPRLQALLRQHCEEEVGHDKWFLRDLVRLAGQVPDVSTVFSPQHALPRKAAYALMGEALGARDDVERLCLLLAMEGTGEIAFGAVEAYLARVGAGDGLLFFGGKHLQAEKDHTLFEEEVGKIIASLELDSDARARACGVVDRTYGAFDVLLDGLAAALPDGHAR